MFYDQYLLFSKVNEFSNIDEIFLQCHSSVSVRFSHCNKTRGWKYLEESLTPGTKTFSQRLRWEGERGWERKSERYGESERGRKRKRERKKEETEKDCHRIDIFCPSFYAQGFIFCCVFVRLGSKTTTTWQLKFKTLKHPPKINSINSSTVYNIQQFQSNSRLPEKYFYLLLFWYLLKATSWCIRPVFLNNFCFTPLLVNYIDILRHP